MGGIDRRSALFGALGGVAAGSVAGVFSGLTPWSASGFADPNARLAHLSFAQQGEDLVMQELLTQLGILHPTYIDIGAHHPIINSNTYLFYAAGSRGLLVEPNPTFAAKIRKERPGDKVLEAGVGFEDGVIDADYYVVRGDGQLNTFSKTQADEIARTAGPGAIERVIKIPLININKVLADNFPQGAPDLFSVDTEGLDLSILRALDFERYRPCVVCAETCSTKGLVIQDILDLMLSKNYSIRGGTFVNTIFVDNLRLFPAATTADAGKSDG